MRNHVRRLFPSLLLVLPATSLMAQTATQPKAAVPASKPAAPAAKSAPTQAPAAKTAPAPAAKAVAPAQRMADPVLATVNGEAIKKSDVIQMLSSYSLPPGREEELYKGAINAVASLKLLQQYLVQKKIEVAAKDIDDTVAKVREELKADNRSLEEALATNGLSFEDFRNQVAQTIRWRNYVMAVATDANLKKNFDENKDFYNRNQVRASHILVKLDPDAPADKKQAAITKLAGIKKEIETGKMSFADAANKYSEDDGNVQTKAGGDLGFFLIKGQFDEKFARAAFKLKKGTVSEPVETPFGYHLIQVTDRKDGPPADFESNKPLITNTIAVELQEKIVEDQRKVAKIEIQPMPADFFPKAAPAPAPTNVAPPAATKGAATKPAPK